MEAGKGAATMRKSVFLTLEGLAYAAFLVLDGLHLYVWSTPVKYGGILLCLLFCFGGDWRVGAALALTALADLFLLVLNREYLVGVAAFCGVQALYLWRIRCAGGWRKLWCITVRGALALGCLAAVWEAGALSPLTALAALYFSQLLCNAVESWSLCRKKYWPFALGLTLFVLCDICVALHNLPGLTGLPRSGIIVFANFAMWLFYLPSQVLLALSAHCTDQANGEGYPYESQ